MTERPSVRLTSLVLTSGTVAAAVLLALGFLLAAFGAGDLSRLASTLGILVLLATPAVGLVITALELRTVQPRTALLALAVLGVLGLAAGIALLQ